MLQKFQDDLDSFKLIWIQFSIEYEGIKIRSDQLVKFFKSLKGNLGMEKISESEVMKNIVKMNLEADDEGFVYFNELLFKSMKAIYGEEHINN